MKKRKKKDLTINIKPFHAEIRRYEGGFIWTFKSLMNTADSRRKIINVRFDRWWIGHLANDLKKVLDEEMIELNRLTEIAGFKNES